MHNFSVTGMGRFARRILLAWVGAVVLIAAPHLVADCSQAPSVSVDFVGPDAGGNGEMVITYAFPDTTSAGQRRVSWTVFLPNDTVGDSFFAANSSGVAHIPWSLSCRPPGTYRYWAAVDSCGTISREASTTRDYPGAEPAVDIEYEGPDAEGHGTIHVHYEFPNTSSPAQRVVELLEEPSNGIGFINPQQREGTWDVPYNYTCRPVGTYWLRATARHCNGVTKIDRQSVVNDATPTVSLSMSEPDENGNVTGTVTYDFPNTDSPDDRTVSRVIRWGNSINLADPYHPPTQSGTWQFTYNLACWAPIPVSFTAYAQSCSGAQASSEVVVTPQHRPEVSMRLDPADPGQAIVTYSFTGTGSPAQRTLRLQWMDGTIIESRPAPHAHGEERFAVPSCVAGERDAIKAMAIACGDESAESSAIILPQCELSCATCTSCVGQPIRLTNGNMRMTDADALPGLPAAFSSRTYDNRRPAIGAFGRGWTSIFDATLKVSGSSAVLQLEDGDRVVFSGSPYVQTYPSGQTAVASLSYDAAGGVYTYRDGRVERRFRASDSRLIGVRALSSPYETTVVYDAAARPSRLIDSSGAWSWTITTNSNGAIASIAVDNEPITWTYAYTPSGDLHTVNSPVGLWRTYTYGAAGLTEARNGTGHLIEGHAYDSSGRATTSTGASGDLQSVTYGLAGRVAGETKTRVVAATGQPADYYSRFIAGRMWTVQIVGACSCGTDDAVYVHDAGGHVVREQNALGYIQQRTFAGDRLVAESSAMRPATCNPATDPALCRLDPDALASASLIATPATLARTFVYGDPNWPDRATRIQTASILVPGQLSEQRWTYDAATGTVLVDSRIGWTGEPAQQETRTTTTALYDGSAGAAFNPGGPFDAAWMSLPQPRASRKTIDGPRTDVSDVTTFVYYPLAAAVPRRLRGRLAAVRNPAGHITRFEDYDAFGAPLRMVDPNGVVQTTATDGIGRLLSTSLPGMAGCDQNLDPVCHADIVTSRVYDAAGALSAEQRPGGGMTTYEYDGRQRVSALSRGPAANDLRERIEYSYDPATGQKSMERSLALESGAWVEKKRASYAYDGSGRLEQITHADNSTIAYTYDADSRLKSVRDENHSSPNTLYAYDPAGRLSKVTQVIATVPGGSIMTAYAYDAHGNLTSVVDPNGNETHYTYDDFGQMIRQQSGVSGGTSYAYDVAGRLVRTVDANEFSTVRTYDVLGRVTTAASTGEMSGHGASTLVTEMVTWSYDDPSAGRFSIGRLSAMTDPSGSTAYSYDRRGSLRLEQRMIGSWASSTAYAYDVDGNRTKLGNLDYTYDFAGRPRSVARRSCAACTPAPVVTSAAYLPFGPESTLVFGNGTTQSKSYDSRYRITENKLTGPASATLADFVYAADAVGNITGIADAVNPAYSRTFGYDELNRLIISNTGSSLWGTAAFGYDAMGSMTSAVVGDWSTTFTYRGTTPKMETSTEQGIESPVEYDLAGNETRSTHAARPAGDVEWSFSSSEVTRTYSPRNLLAAVVSAHYSWPRFSEQGYGYTYDGRGLRVHMESSDEGAGEYVYSPELSLSLIHRPDGETELIWFNGHPVAQFSSVGPSLLYTFTDHLGTPIVQTDAGAAIAWFGDYEPYGRLYSLRADHGLGQPLRLPGQDLAAQSGGGVEDHYNIFRWYTAGWGRYTQADPIGVAGLGLFDMRSDSLRSFDRSEVERRPLNGLAELDDRRTNPYGYVEANPVRFADPTGLVKFLCEVHADSKLPLIKLGPSGAAASGVCIYNGECKGPDDLMAVATGVELWSTPPCEECYDVVWYVWDSDTGSRVIVKKIYKWWKHLWPFDKHKH